MYIKNFKNIMKYKLLLLLYIISLFQVRGEEAYQYLPLFEEGKRWVVETCVNYDTKKEYYFYNVYCASEEIIDGEQIFTLISINEKDDTESQTYLLKERDRKIYIWDDSYNNWLISLDFNAKKGELTDHNKELSNMGCYVCDEGFTSMNGYVRRWLFINDLTYWIEGIGSPTFAHMSNGPLPTCGGVPFKTGRIVECYKNDVLLFSYDDYKRLSSLSDVKNPNITESKIFDLYGREVKTVLPGSVYIRNGKKFIGE